MELGVPDISPLVNENERPPGSAGEIDHVTTAPPSSITYTPSSFTLTKDIPMTAVTPTANGDPVDNWSISPTLPAGLSFDNSTGEISGTPTVVSQSTSYTVTATNNGGSGTAIITIEVQDVGVTDDIGTSFVKVRELGV